jgi:hypothetical protein
MMDISYRSFPDVASCRSGTRITRPAISRKRSWWSDGIKPICLTVDMASRVIRMNTGEKTIDWLFREQLRVDPEWSIVGSESSEDGETAYLISTRTELLRNLELTDRASAGITALLMCFASMAGPVFDEKTGTLSLCSLVRVHESIREWMSALISVSSVLQIAEARIMAAELAKAFGAESAGSLANGCKKNSNRW